MATSTVALSLGARTGGCAPARARAAAAAPAAPARSSASLSGARLGGSRVAGAARAGARRSALTVSAAKAPPPTVADTKRKFVEAYRFPVPAVYGNVLQELLVAQHLARYNVNYAYSAVAALGFCSVYDQLMEGFSQPENKDAIFKAFLKAVDESPEQYRKDQAALAAAASSSGGVDGLLSMEPLSALKARAAAGTLVYSKFVGIGLFRLLELTGATEPAALARLADASGAPLAKVNADLTLYKGLLSKLAAAKELMAEYLAREAKKTAQRMAEKEAKAAGSGEGTSASPA